MDKTNENFRGLVTGKSTFPAAIHAWEIHLADQGRSVYTIKAFRSDIQLMSSYFSPDKTIESVTTRDIRGFLDWMNNERKVPCSPKTYSRRVTSIKSFFKWLNTFGAIENDPSESVIQKSVISPLPEILTAEEYTLVLDTANRLRTGTKPDPRPMALLQLLLSTGIKKGETLELTKKHIERDDPETPCLYVRYANPSNRYKERKIDLPVDWLAVYDEYLLKYDPADKIFPWSPRRLEYLLEDIGVASGLNKHLSFAMCRWTCAVHDFYTSTEPETIRIKLGVSKIQWREIFAKIKQLQSSYVIEKKQTDKESSHD